MTDNGQHPDSAGARSPRSGGSGGASSGDSGHQGAHKRRRRRRSRRRGSRSAQPQSNAQANSQDHSGQGADNGSRSSEGQTQQRSEGGNGTGNGNRRRRSARGRRGRSRNRQRPENANSAQNSAQSSDNGSAGGQSAGANDKRETNSSTGSKSRQRKRSRGGRGRRGNARNRQHDRYGQHARQRAQSSRIETRDETSAGGLVVSGFAEALSADGSVDLGRVYVALIGRLDRRGRLLWSMPKGHVEPGESRAATAEREVWEETGLHGNVITELGVIDYWFVSEGVRIHKTVHHYLLRYADGDLNDEDPEVTEVSWIPVSELIEHLAYADERKLARIALDLLPELVRKENSARKAETL
ncbi:NUDIX hydrolase [Corynebacterium tapiri]|uniref:NUDIX hydrolase n=1 Tax=Corynebacterium tapiri TaxID=1448266 RepID=A0A5C4U416_9CORY|nr:NUDIX hydrolase [Corynebacterium tapiri]TNL96869.1 NUDIX hydrolase [Corynebacterium tapiri]